MRKLRLLGFVLLAAVCGRVYGLGLGDKAPEFKAGDWQGNPVELGQYLGKKNVLLVFSRYIGCAWCQMFIIDLHQKRAEIEKTGTEVIIITVSTREVTREYKPPRDFSFRLIPDPEMSLYRLYGVDLDNKKMTGNVWLQTVRFIKYLGDYDWVKRGLEGDHYLAPACILVDREGRIRYQHLGRDVADNPQLETILGELNKL